tara:strand:+ start:6584 stop:6760 length:177 start_codon:yes stop_codon:yes gene_type:complete
MHSIAILGFFSLVIVFFFTGKNDFGLKPSSAKRVVDQSRNSETEISAEQSKELEEIKK